MKKINWGIVSTGSIANHFADALSYSEVSRLKGVASRELAKAELFKDKYNAEAAFSDYDSMFECDDIDIVYIATPHNCHYPLILKALEHNKAVLCEKPMVLTGYEAKLAVELARAKNIFLMEAMWTRFLPLYDEIAKIIDSGRIGQIMQVRADFSFTCERNPEWRLLNPKLAGGALFDVGVYTLLFILNYLGTNPDTIKAVSYIGNTNVDEQTTCILKFNEFQTGIMTCSICMSTDNTALIIGEKGYIEIPSFYQANQAKLCISGKEETIQCPAAANGFIYEIREAERCLMSNITASPKMPHEHTIAAANIFDEIREQANIKRQWD